MTEITVSKADPIGVDAWPDAHIHITGVIPRELHGPQSYESGALELFMDAQAAEIEEILHISLPGGTYDRLLGRMLARKASRYRVSHASFEKQAAS